MAVKRFSNEQLEMLRATLGDAAVEKLKAQHEEVIPTRSRGPVSRVDERLEVFQRVVGEPTGEKRINVVELLDDAQGFSPTADNPTYWAGLAGGSEIAYQAGFKAVLKLERNLNPKTKGPGDTYTLMLVCTPLTDADKAKRKELINKRDNKKLGQRLSA